jgi:hypothetical protein
VNIPQFTAIASIYRTSNHYHSSATTFADTVAGGSVVTAYLPGPETQSRCSGCTDVCVAVRDICFAKVAVVVAEWCAGTLGFGCAAAAAWGYIQTASCEATYLYCFGLCNIPSTSEVGWESPCCPKVCGVPTSPGIGGSGCCDHGEACVGAHNPNTRDGCCPVGQECGGNCCAKAEYCLPGGVCSEYPGTFDNPSPPPPPPNPCFNGVPCFDKCCPPGLQCCGGTPAQPDCRTTCVH